MARKLSPLHRGIVDFFREEMIRRYQLGNVRRFEVFTPLTNAQITALRDYFFDEAYVPGEKRHLQDAAIEHMLDVFLSPRRAAPLTPVAWNSLRALGRQAPTAIAAAKKILGLYDRARDVEYRLVEAARRKRYRVRDTRNREKMLRLVLVIPEREIRQLIDNVLRLFHMTANMPMIEAGLHMLGNAAAAMANRPRQYTGEEVEAVRYAFGLAQGILDHVKGFGPEQFDALVEGVLAVELDWYENEILTRAKK
ncbi:MAG: hypothetical protein ACLFTT_16105 [Candidatus Hydrogenedentota bacterium]